MILKAYSLGKSIFKIGDVVLFYGKNDGLKKEEILKIISLNKNANVTNYDEKQILDDQDNFFNNILSKSLFEKEKIVIINRASDKIFKIIEELIEKDIQDTLLIINSESLEKKSKLRSIFEKDKKMICIAFYPDNLETLSKITQNFLRERKITISQSNINLIVSRCNGDRGVLKNELWKIENFTLGGKKITNEDLIKLTNLIENFSISELIDNCLAKNKRKTIHILNENNFNNEDCILITRTFLSKSKKILKLCSEFENNKNIDLTISSAKPPIFWKDKEITKQQIYKWTPKNIKRLIFRLNEVELLVKKNVNNSINFISDFILEQSSLNTNN